MSSPTLRFECPKCHHTAYETGEIRASGGFWSKIFDVQNRKLTTVTCEQCRYTELIRSRQLEPRPHLRPLHGLA